MFLHPRTWISHGTSLRCMLRPQHRAHAAHHLTTHATTRLVWHKTSRDAHRHPFACGLLSGSMLMSGNALSHESRGVTAIHGVQTHPPCCHTLPHAPALQPCQMDHSVQQHTNALSHGSDAGGSQCAAAQCSMYASVSSPANCYCYGHCPSLLEQCGHRRTSSEGSLIWPLHTCALATLFLCNKQRGVTVILCVHRPRVHSLHVCPGARPVISAHSWYTYLSLARVLMTNGSCCGF